MESVERRPDAEWETVRKILEEVLSRDPADIVVDFLKATFEDKHVLKNCIVS